MRKIVPITSAALVIVGLAMLVMASPTCTISQNLIAAPFDQALAEQQRKELVPGVEYRRYTMAASSDSLSWFLSFGVARTQEEKEQAERCVSELGLKPRLRSFIFPGASPMRYAEILAGDFESRKAVQEEVASHTMASSCEPEIRASGFYPDKYPAPFLIHVLEIDPAKFNGKLVAMRRDGLATGRELPSKILREVNGIAATNGGYFVMKDKDGAVGESAGISILSGVMQSEPTAGRPWVSIDNRGHLKVEIHRDQAGEIPALVTSDGRRIILDGINRVPGVLRNCGSLRPGGPDSLAWHDVTCSPKSELIAITGAFGSKFTPTQKELAYRLAEDGELASFNMEDVVADEGVMLVAIGDRRNELKQLAEEDVRLRLETGRYEPFAVNGGPVLLEGGDKVEREDTEGWPFSLATRGQADELHQFVNLRFPRTALGITKEGKILLVVVDGWRYRVDSRSLTRMNGGASLSELTEILLLLGAYDAINLDGGGSSVMALSDGIASHPSDDAGERPVGDSLVLLPARATERLQLH